jgi:hypothetical protein
MPVPLSSRFPAARRRIVSRAGLVITSQMAPAEPPYWWRLALGDAGEAAGAHVLAHEPAARNPAEDRKWRGLPPQVSDGTTMPVRRDELEFRTEALLDILAPTLCASAPAAGRTSPPA